ncbi:reverse transcriptase domain-containing protein [Tanacetum coccineum]
MIVRSLSPDNGIIGRPGIREIQAVPSTAHGMLKFPANRGIVTIRSTILIPAECTTVITSSKEVPKEAEVRPKISKIALYTNFPDQEVTIGGTLSAEGRTKLLPPDTDGGVRREKSAFHTSQGVYCYTKMPFGLKNAGATYQRLVDKAFDSQVDQNMEVYVDDLVIKSHTEAEMIRDINETFQTLRRINMKLNPKKCTFGAREGMFLGYMISPEGIKPCLDKTEVVLQLPGTSLQAAKAALVGVTSAGSTNVAGRLQKWSDMLGEHNITYRPRTSVKGQILADFLVEKPDENLPETPTTDIPQEPWTLFTDGSSSSNNEAEYEALIVGLRIASQMGVRNVNVSVDSKLVANHVLGAYVAKEQNMIKYLEKVKSLVLVEILKEKSIHEEEVATVVKEERKLRIKARHYELLEGVLYKRSFLKPWLRCVGPLQADYVIREIHEGSCSMHAGPRSVVAKAMRLGYYWSTMHRDAREIIRIDIAGPFPEGPGKVKFLIVAMDYFTKWIEAKVVATITGNQVKKFVWDNIVCRFGLLGEIVSDNDKQFSDNPFKDWCNKLNIAQRFALVKHPQSNGLVERANRSLSEGIKARLGEGNKNWIEELPHVLWAHRTMIKSSHDDTPFSLTYGTKAVIPAEIGMPTYRIAAVDIVHNDEELRLNLDLLEEKRERAAIYKAKAKMKMTKYYNARVRGVAFRPGDFVYRSNDASHAAAGGKLGPKWEGPYEVTEALGDGAYKLRTMEGADLPQT